MYYLKKKVETNLADSGQIIRVDLEKSKPKGEVFCGPWVW